MELNPYLQFNGQCAAAFKFYEQALGGKIVDLRTFGESPMKDQVPSDWHDKVMHARIVIGNQVLMGSDPPPSNFSKLQGMSMSIMAGSAAEGERIFSALAQGATVTMPFAKTFWSPGFGMLTDRFGVPWMVNVEAAAA